MTARICRSRAITEKAERCRTCFRQMFGKPKPSTTTTITTTILLLLLLLPKNIDSYLIHENISIIKLVTECNNNITGSHFMVFCPRKCFRLFGFFGKRHFPSGYADL